MNDIYILPQAAQDTLGGIKAAAVEDKYTQECRIDKETGKLYTRSADRFLIEDTFEGNPVMSSSCREGDISLIEGYGESTQFTTQGNQLFDINVYEGKSSAGAEATVDNGVIKIIGTPTKDTWVQSDRISIEDFKKYFKVGGLSIKPHKSSGCNFDFGIYINSTVVKENNSPYEITEEFYNNYSGNAYYFIELKSSSSPSGYIQPMVYQSGSGEYEPYTGGAPSPSPDYPQEVKSSVVTGIKITDGAEKEQSIQLSAPITLRGIPSESGNVTIDGQKYLSDYIGQKEGVYGVFRKTREDIDDGSQNWSVYASPLDGGFIKPFLKSAKLRLPGICNQGKVSITSASWKNTIIIGFNNTFLYFLSNIFYNSDLSDKGLANWKTHLAENPLKTITVADEETFEPLPEADQQTLKDLKTFYPTSIISWETEDNSGAWGKTILKQDMKLYIQNKIKELSNNSITQIQNINSNLIR